MFSGIYHHLTLKPTKFHGCIIIIKIFKAIWLLLAAILDFRRHIEFFSCLDGVLDITSYDPKTTKFHGCIIIIKIFKAYRWLLAAILDFSHHIEFFSRLDDFLI